MIGGEIADDIQINDTHCHRRLQNQYQDLEMKLMLEQLEKDPTNIPTSSRNELMSKFLA